MEQKDIADVCVSDVYNPEGSLEGVFHVRHPNGEIEQFSFKSKNYYSEVTGEEKNGDTSTPDSNSESDR